MILNKPFNLDHIMKAHSKRILPAVFFALTFIVVSLFFYEGHGCGYEKQDVNYELVVRSKTHEKIRNYDKVILKSSNKASLTSFLTPQLFIKKPSLRLSIYRPAINYTMNWHPDLPSKHIISILQKTNRWHKSSDDEPSPYIFA